MHRLRLLPLFVAALLAVTPFAHAAGGSVVVSQVFAGGGNSGAPYTNDFVELLNRGTGAVDVTGWTVQYAPATSTSWQATALSGSIQPGHYYLVQLASSAAVGASLPAPDATGTTNLANTGGKIALVDDGTALTCGATAGTCSALASVVDLVGYGGASDYEGAAPAPALSATTALVRDAGGCTDTGANDADFSAAAPSPRNGSSASASCTGSTPATIASAGATVDLDVQPVISIALERPSISFGTVVPGQTPSPISERVTVVSSDPAGYSVTVHRTAFTPADLPLGIAASSAATLLPIPIVPAADLLLAAKTAATPPAGEFWPAVVGFTAPIPSLTAGHYTTTITFTVIGR
jgi:lamin tail-like protein